ncbi:polysaccharide deacetylase family protein [Fulvivirga sp. 29W222]|uniref:Polysaccharide deacetylase family protein n=1 Tax=Fulvivirga marina TaxID=2494733 RepID=A0A937KDS5_9BACT|nr:polysaccharide deacetylase family protein [Fulvivirga marina]MBL6446523.1 polysaccharide deacetylase family protein [Fulvivirga marina]
MTRFVIVRNVFLVIMSGVVLLDYFSFVHWIVYVLAVLVFVSFLVIGSSVMKYNVFLSAYTFPENTENKIAITFDDGPHLFTESVLDILSKYKSKASFFLIGKNIEEYPAIAQRIVDEGHVVGNHSYSHHSLFSLFRKKRIADEIRKTNRLITDITGKTVNCFRPPYGVTNPAIAAAVKTTHMQVIGWNLRSFDTAVKNPEKVTARVISKLKAGSVILLHDNREQTAQILEAILLHAREKNYTCVTIDEIFKLN